MRTSITTLTPYCTAVGEAAVRTALDTRPKARVGARACAREFGFDKSIGWKVFQIGYAADFVAVLSAMPGARGWEIVIAKFAAVGVSGTVIDELRTALHELESQLAGRRIDRSTLSGMAAASVESDDSRRQILRIRKQASDAMAVIYGVYARARVGAYLCMPSRTEGMVDLAACTVIEGLERRRPGAPWSIFDPIWSYDSTGARIGVKGGSLAASASASALLADLSSPGISRDEIAAHAELMDELSDASGALGDAVITGPTLTNINDFRAILIQGA
jgi:hypothetical protein